MGSKKQKKSIKNELQIRPLFCGQIEVKVKDQIKWLGQILSSGGLAQSVAETVAAREGKIRGACLEITQVVNDWRSRAVGWSQLSSSGSQFVSPVYYMGQEHGWKSQLKQKRN